MGARGQAACAWNSERDPARHDAQAHRDRARRDVLRLDVRGHGARPTVRARVGDRIKFTMSNRSDEPVPGLPHDRGATGALDGFSLGDGGAGRQVPLDRARADDLVRVHPQLSGRVHVPLRHADGARAHRSGMYGMLIVEPRGGYPTEVDREYVVIQSEFYTRPDPQLARPTANRSTCWTATAPSQGTDLHGFQRPLQRDGRPASRSRARRAVRLFVMNVGPSNTSSFHVLGTIFDRVWIEGGPDPQFRGINAAAGLFKRRDRRVHHSRGRKLRDGRPPLRERLARRDRDCRRGKPEGGDPEHHNIPAPGVPTDHRPRRGSSHSSEMPGLSLAGRRRQARSRRPGHDKRHDADWMTRWLKEPEKMLETDPTAKAMLDKR